MSNKVKWCPEHFPQGTQFTVLDTYRFGKLQTTFTVKEIHRNGAKSYVLETTSFNETIGVNDSFNLECVESIVTRGSGKVIIDPGCYGATGKTIKQDDFFLYAKSDGLKATSGRQYTLSPNMVIAFYGRQHFPHNTSIEFGRFVHSALDAGVFVSELWHNFTVFRFNPKRLKKWIRANWTRHLTNLKAADREEQLALAAQYEEDWKIDMASDFGARGDGAENPSDESECGNDERFALSRITENDLLETSMAKHWEKRNALLDEIQSNDACVDPSLYQSRVLSLDEATKLWHENSDRGAFFRRNGFSMWTNARRWSAFVTGDSQFGWKQLKDDGWTCMTFRHLGTAYTTFPSFKEFFDHFATDSRILESTAELVALLNT